MTILKGIGVFLLWWFIATAIAISIEIILGLMGGTLGKYGMGLVELIIMTMGLFKHYTKNKKTHSEAK